MQETGEQTFVIGGLLSLLLLRGSPGDPLPPAQRERERERPTPKAARNNTEGGNTRHTLVTTKPQRAHPARRGHLTPQTSNGDVTSPGLETKEPAIRPIKRGFMRSLRKEGGASRHTSRGDKLSTGCTARSNESNESKRSGDSHSRPPPEPTSRGCSPSCSTCISNRESPHRGRPLTPDLAPQRRRAPRPHRSSHSQQEAPEQAASPQGEDPTTKQATQAQQQAEERMGTVPQHAAASGTAPPQGQSTLLGDTPIRGKGTTQ